MVAVSLTGIWINLDADRSKKLFFSYGSSLQVQPGNSIAKTVYASGNSRKTRQPGYERKLTASLLAVRPDQRNMLELDVNNGGWLGETACIRDYRGRKFFGWWDPPLISEHNYNAECDLQLVFTSLSWSDDR